MLRAPTLLFSLCCFACTAPRLTSDAAAEPREPAPAEKGEREGRRRSEWHQRLQTSRGPVHVWTPAGYDPATAGLILYVHGYYTDVDGAWRKHALAQQFAVSGRNALFIAPEAPANDGERVLWPKLDELLREVRRGAGVEIPEGRRIAVAHSGGFRTVRAWLRSRVDTVVLLDALYGAEADLRRWLDEDGQSDRRLLIVADNTTRRSERFIEKLGGALVLDAIPGRAAADEVPFDARLVFLYSQYDHMRIVTARRVIPSVLSLTRVERVLR